MRHRPGLRGLDPGAPKPDGKVRCMWCEMTMREEMTEYQLRCRVRVWERLNILVELLWRGRV